MIALTVLLVSSLEACSDCKPTGGQDIPDAELIVVSPEASVLYGAIVQVEDNLVTITYENEEGETIVAHYDGGE